MKLFSKKKKRALIIGIDGVPHSLLDTYIKQDVMPNLKNILGRGFTLHRMNASIPDISSVSWTSFNTGVNPGEHGIYGFTDIDPDSYSLSFPNFKNVQAPAFWEIIGKTTHNTSTLSQKYDGPAGQAGHPYRSVILNVPHTYPALPMNGILVSGFVAIDLKKACFPESAYTTLHSMNYQIDVEVEKARKDKPGFMNSLFECFEVRKKAISHFLKEKDCDLFFACITETDRLHHFFFDASTDRGNPYHESFLRFYGELDQYLKYLVEEFFGDDPEEGFLMILSDHGFAPVKKEVYLNRFLEEGGYLSLGNEGDFYEKISPTTRAFTLDPGRIHIHDRDRYRRGSVAKKEKLSLLKEIKNALGNLKGENGEQILDKIFEKNSIYQGPQTRLAPDMVCLPKDGYDLKGSLEKKEVLGRPAFAGMHTYHDAFCVLPEHIRLSQSPSIHHLTEYILQYYFE